MTQLNTYNRDTGDVFTIVNPAWIPRIGELVAVGEKPEAEVIKVVYNYSTNTVTILLSNPTK